MKTSDAADRAAAEAIARVLKTADVLADDSLLCEAAAIENALAAGMAARRLPLVPPNADAAQAIADELKALKRLVRLDAGLEARLTDKLKSNADRRAREKETKAAEEKAAIAERAQRAAEKLEQVRRAAAARLRRD